MLGTYVDTQMYSILDPSTVEADGIAGATQGASTGLAMEKNSPLLCQQSLNTLYTYETPHYAVSESKLSGRVDH